MRGSRPAPPPDSSAGVAGILAKHRSRASHSLVQYGMSLNEGTYFQRDMSLKRNDWVDHSGHGDRHERDATLYAGAVAGFCAGNRAGAVRARRGRGRTLCAYRGGAQALGLPAARAQGEGSGAALPDPHHGLLAPAGDTAGAPVPGPGAQSQGYRAPAHGFVRTYTRTMWACWPRPTPCTMVCRGSPPGI